MWEQGADAGLCLPRSKDVFGATVLVRDGVGCLRLDGFEGVARSVLAHSIFHGDVISEVKDGDEQKKTESDEECEAGGGFHHCEAQSC